MFYKYFSDHLIKFVDVIQIFTDAFISFLNILISFRYFTNLLLEFYFQYFLRIFLLFWRCFTNDFSDILKRFISTIFLNELLLMADSDQDHMPKKAFTQYLPLISMQNCKLRNLMIKCLYLYIRTSQMTFNSVNIVIYKLHYPTIDLLYTIHKTYRGIRLISRSVT